MASVAVTDVEATFDNISKLYDAHHQFVTELGQTVFDWSPQTSVGAHLRTLVRVFSCGIYCFCGVDYASLVYVLPFSAKYGLQGCNE